MRIHAISVSKTKGVRKNNVSTAVLRPDHGIESDAHAGEWHRQVSLLAKESIEKMVKRGLEVGPGDFAENITTEGISFKTAAVGRKLFIGDSVQLLITQIGKECHEGCYIRQVVGDCIMPREASSPG